MRSSAKSCTHLAPRGFDHKRATLRIHGFTLIELMVVIGILISLATLTAIGVAKVTKDARFSKSVSQVMGALETARTLAIKEHRTVLLAFTVKTERTGSTVSGGVLTDPITKQWTRIVAARLRDELVNADQSETTANQGSVFMDLFEPHPNFTPIDLPVGIKVAVPQMDFDRRDAVWITQPTFYDSNTNFDEMEYGAMIGVMFGADGALLTKLTGGGSANMGQGRYVVLDADQNGAQLLKNAVEDASGYFTYNIENEEVNVQLAPFLSVFNDAAMRELYDANNWKGKTRPPWAENVPCSTYGKGRTRLNCDESEYINQFGDKIYFNRYTGRAEVLKR